MNDPNICRRKLVETESRKEVVVVGSMCISWNFSLVQIQCVLR